MNPPLQWKPAYYPHGHIHTYQQSNQPNIVMNSVHTFTPIVKSCTTTKTSLRKKTFDISMTQNVGFILYFTSSELIWFSSICSTANWKFTFVLHQKLTFKFKVRIEARGAQIATRVLLKGLDHVLCIYSLVVCLSFKCVLFACLHCNSDWHVPPAADLVFSLL